MENSTFCAVLNFTDRKKQQNMTICYCVSFFLACIFQLIDRMYRNPDLQNDQSQDKTCQRQTILTLRQICQNIYFFQIRIFPYKDRIYLQFPKSLIPTIYKSSQSFYLSRVSKMCYTLKKIGYLMFYQLIKIDDSSIDW